jgi:hypothetical protein
VGDNQQERIPLAFFIVSSNDGFPRISRRRSTAFLPPPSPNAVMSIEIVVWMAAHGRSNRCPRGVVKIPRQRGFSRSDGRPL